MLFEVGNSRINVRIPKQWLIDHTEFFENNTPDAAISEVLASINAAYMGARARKHAVIAARQHFTPNTPGAIVVVELDTLSFHQFSRWLEELEKGKEYIGFEVLIYRELFDLLKLARRLHAPKLTEAIVPKMAERHKYLHNFPLSYCQEVCRFYARGSPLFDFCASVAAEQFFHHSDLELDEEPSLEECRVLFSKVPRTMQFTMLNMLRVQYGLFGVWDMYKRLGKRYGPGMTRYVMSLDHAWEPDGEKKRPKARFGFLPPWLRQSKKDTTSPPRSPVLFKPSVN